MIAKKTLGLASIMNAIPYKLLVEIVEQMITQPVVNHQMKYLSHF